MKYNIKSLSNNAKMLIEIKKEIEISKDYNVTNNVAEISFLGNLRLRDGLYLLNGDIVVEGSISCAKCLKEIDFKTEINVSEKFSNNDSEDTGVTEFWEFKGDEIDIEELLMTEVLLNLPFKETCEEDCKGLCKYCGVDLNKTKCSCKKPIDPRFESLLSLLEDTKEV